MSNYTDSLGLEEITPGDQAGLWGTTTNNNLALIDQAVTGVTPITEFNGVSGTTKTLTDFNGAADESRSAVLNITGTATGPNTVVVPNKQKTYLVRNNTGQNVVFQTASPSATYTVESGNSILIFCDGNNNVYTGIQAPSTGTLTVSGGGTGVTTFTAGFVTSAGGTTNLSSVPYINMATDVTGVLGVTNGGTGASTSAGAPFALKGANSDITSLTGLTTPLAPTRGGTGSSTAPSAGQVPIGVTGGTYTPGTITGSGGTTVTSTSGGIIISSVTGGTGTVTAVTGTGTVNGLTLSGTVTTSGSLTLSGSLSGTASSLTAGAVTNGLYTNVTNTITTAGSLTANASAVGDQRISVNGGGGYSTGMSPGGIQIGVSGWGFAAGSLSGTVSVVQGGGFSTDFRGTGNFQSNNSPNWATTSDINIKTNIRPINGALEKLCALNPTHFDYKDKVGETQTGFIAQEFEQVFPGHTLKTEVEKKYQEFVPEGVDELIAIDMNLTAYLVKAIQELKSEVDSLKAQLAAK